MTRRNDPAIHHAPPARSRGHGDLSGRSNLNPKGMSLFELIREDFETHERNALAPGFLAVALHRFGNWRMDVKPRVLRAPLSASYHAMYVGMSWFFGINLQYSVQLGRRVRLWHHGGMWLGARSIGDDVHIHPNVTIGMARASDDPEGKPVIEDRVDIGAGAAILGEVRVGADSVVGPNSVVVRSFPPRSTLFGVPARPVRIDPEKSGDT
jgi:serine O-acetyltransferase